MTTTSKTKAKAPVSAQETQVTPVAQDNPETSTASTQLPIAPVDSAEAGVFITTSGIVVKRH